jgi:hypothetical protein
LTGRDGIRGPVSTGSLILDVSSVMDKLEPVVLDTDADDDGDPDTGKPEREQFPTKSVVAMNEDSQGGMSVYLTLEYPLRCAY